MGTDSVRFSELQKRSDSILRLFENSPFSILLTDVNNCVVYCNKTFMAALAVDDFSALKGHSIGDIYVRSVGTAFAEAVLQLTDSVKNSMQASMATDISVKFPAQQATHIYTIQSSPMMSPDGVLEGVLSCYHETGGARRAELDEHARIMLDATPLAASFWDAQGNMIDCNLEAVRLFGLERKSDYTEHFYELNPLRQPDGELTEDKAAREIAAAFATGYRRFDWMYRTLGGEELPVETTLVRVASNGEYRLAAFSRDLREMRAIEEQRLAAIKRSLEMEMQARSATAASKAKSRFLSTMSHEIRTPMNAIIGMASLLAHEPLTERQRSHVNDITVSSHILLHLINDILDISKIEAGKFQLIPVDYNIEPLLDNLRSEFTFAARAKGISFTMEIDPLLPACLYGDELRLRQTLVNVLGNAVKFTKAGGVSLRAFADGCLLRFVVSDTGVGIRKEDMPNLFNDFGRLNIKENKYIPGTGLGLAITRNLIDMMGGSIEVESEYGVGSKFVLSVPLVPGDARNIACAQVENEYLFAPDARILVVDDNDINLIVASELLTMFAVKSDTAQSGEEAINKIAASHYDIVFMDHMMPEMDGVETTRILRQKYGKALTIIALTANAIEGVREELLGAEMDDYLSKPIDVETMNRMLHKWLPTSLKRSRQGDTPHRV